MEKITKFGDLAISGFTEGQGWICCSEEGLDLENPWLFIPQQHPCLCPAWSSLKVSMLCRMSPIRDLSVLCQHQPNLITEPGQNCIVYAFN